MALKAYLQLVRLPNVFTAAADSLAGWLLVRGSLRQPGQWVPLVLASVCLYAGGIVLNDVFDVEVDRRERPGRPLPSGRVGWGRAAALGGTLLGLGGVAAILSGTARGALVAPLLAGCILAYDAGLKRTALGPQIMGACRGLNLLLGTTAAADLGGPVAWLLAGSYAAFVMGVTWISRSEVDAGHLRNVRLGIVLQNLAFAGLIAASVRPDRIGAPTVAAGRVVPGVALLALLAIAVDRRTLRAYWEPSPRSIQRAVRFGILSLVWLHVGWLLALRGPGPAAMVGLLWFPAVYAGRWIEST